MAAGAPRRKLRPPQGVSGPTHSAPSDVAGVDAAHANGDGGSIRPLTGVSVTLRRLLILAGVLAAALLTFGWMSAQRGDLDFKELEARWAAEGPEYAVLQDGVRLRFRDEGRSDAPAILLIHGFGESLHTWEPWVAELGANYRLVSMDLPGHGLTYTPQGWVPSPERYGRLIEEFARARGLERFILVGQSMGGDVAWRYARRRPDQVQALVLVSSAGWETEAEDLPARAYLAAVDNPLGRALLKNLDPERAVRAGLERAYADDSALTDALVERRTELLRAPGNRDVVLDLMVAWNRREPATAADLRALRMPVLVLHGAEDAVVPVEHGRKFQQAIPGAKLVVYPGVGHFVNEERPDRSSEDLYAFLSPIAPPPTGSPPPTGLLSQAGATPGDPFAGRLFVNPGLPAAEPAPAPTLAPLATPR